ncbi:MAG: hypothetical protein LAN63_18700 [Acidobacteriia bacterium]|nr:hypothetical protein [Terriglobia bacterium]
MQTRIFLAAVLLVSLAHAREPKHYQSGVLLQMDSVECGVDENNGKSVAGEMLGTDSGHKKTHELLCQEYVLQTDRMIFRIRPRDDKHPVLLPVGGIAMFRLEKDRMILRSEDLDDKERDYNVVSMTPREATAPAEAASAKSNHLQ